MVMGHRRTRHGRQRRHCHHDEVPLLDRVVVWVDPAVTDRDTSDSHAVQVDGISRDRTLYRLWSWEQRATPLESLKTAFYKALEYGADSIGIETDQGGDTWKSVFREARRELQTEMEEEAALFQPDSLEHEEVLDRIARLNAIRYRWDKAGKNRGDKEHRSSRMLTDYERGRIIHVFGTHHVLESALMRFPRYKPLDLVDACFYGWKDLMGHTRATTSSAAGQRRTRSTSPSPYRSRRLRRVV